MNLDRALELLDSLAKQVGFENAALPKLEQAPEIPALSRLWVAPYAQLLDIQSEPTEDALRAAAQRGQEWLDLACMRTERKTENVVDGYLLILLTNPPEKSVQVVIRELELDPTACRKHFAWPEPSAEDDDLIWARIFRVTAIGIPTSPESSKMTGSPILETPLQKRLLSDIKDYKASEAARRHAENPSLAPDS
jgi:hypothetical protein